MNWILMNQDELDSAVFSGISHWICLLPSFFHLLPFRQKARNSQGKNQGHSRIQLGWWWCCTGGDCGGNFACDLLQWNLFLAIFHHSHCARARCWTHRVEPRQTGFQHQNHMTTMSALMSLSLCGSCGDSMTCHVTWVTSIRSIPGIQSHVITPTNSGHHV